MIIRKELKRERTDKWNVKKDVKEWKGKNMKIRQIWRENKLFFIGNRSGKGTKWQLKSDGHGKEENNKVLNATQDRKQKGEERDYFYF